MDINRANMEALFQTYNAAFTEGMQSANVRPTPEDLLIEDIAMMGSSAGSATVHAWLCQVGGMREWLGDRVLANIKSGKLTVINREFEKTIAIRRSDIKDDQVGLYTPLVGAMGNNAASLWLKLGALAMLENGNWADGAAFFGTTRKYGANTISNLTTDALSATTFKAGKTAMESLVLDGDEPGEVVPKYLVVGPSLRDTAWDIVKNEFVSSGTGKGGALKNAQQGACELKVCRRFVGAYANHWRVLGEQAGMKALYVQRRELPYLTRMDRDDDYNVFMKGDFFYGTAARGEAFLTLPHLAYAGIVAAG
jgi:phage major head subunit gpT-like protein